MRRTCRFPPKKTVRNRSGVRIIRAPFFVRINCSCQAALPLEFIASSANRPVSSAM